MSITKLMLGAAAVGLLFAAGCVVREEPVYYSSPGPGGEVVVGEAPPAPVVEVQPVPPITIVDPFWIAGWWAWDGRWIWRHGYWAARPHPGAIWVPHAWVHGSRGWIHGGGHWR